MSIAFDDVRLEMCYDLGMVRTGGFNTLVNVTPSGIQNRIQKREIELGRWETGERRVLTADKDYLYAFFRARKGRHRGFRVRDWTDFMATDQALAVDGTNLSMLESASGLVTKPNGTITYKRGGSPFAGAVVDPNTGIVTLTADVTKNITAITKASNGQITAPSHGYTNGQKVVIGSVGGMTQINGLTATVGGATTNTFTTGINTSAFTTYTSGGTASKYVQPGETLTWSGAFDKPVWFDVDWPTVRFDMFSLTDPAGYAYFINSIPLVEIHPEQILAA